MEPIKLEFIVKGDIERELSRVRLAIKGVGDQSYASFDRLLKDSDRSFNSLSAGTRSTVGELQGLVSCLRANEQAQEALYASYERGEASLADYERAQSRLSAQQVSLRQRAAELTRQVEDEIRATGMATGSLNQKMSVLSRLQREYSALSETERNNASVGGELARQVKALNAEITAIQSSLRQERQEEALVQGSLKERIVTLGRLQEEYARLGKAQRESATGTNLLSQMRQADGEISRLQSGMVRLRGGAAGFDSLGMSIQQVARELPSLTMGINMFALAISNNLPILADNLRMARLQYAALLAEGKKGVPVWKQVLTSLVSWQTALVVAITLLSVYGKDIWNWVKSLAGVKDALDGNMEALDQFRSKVSEASSGTIAEFKRLSAEWGALGDSLEKKRRFILENTEAIKRMGVSVGNASDADLLFVRQEKAFIDSLVARAKAAASMEIAGDKYKEAVKKMIEAESMPETKTRSYWNYAGAANGGFEKITFTEKNQNRIDKEKEATALFKQGDMIARKGAEYARKESDILTEAGLVSTDQIIANSVAAIEASITQKKEALKKLTNKEDYAAAMAEIKKEEALLKGITGDTDAEHKKLADSRKRLNDSILENELKLQADRISIMEDGKTKRVALAMQETKDTIAAIQKEKEEYRKGAKESKEKVDPTVIKTFDDRELAARAKEKADIARMEKEYADEYRQRTKALTDVFLNEEERKLSAIRTRYAEERKWADQQLKTGGMTKEEHKSYTSNIDKAEKQETYRSLLDNLNDYKQQEKDLRDKWDTDIAVAAEAKDAYLVAKLMEGKQKALSSLNGQMLQESAEWQQLFGNLENLTVDQIDKLIKTIKSKAKDLKLNPVDMKAVTDSLKEGENKIKTMNPFKSLASHLKEYEKAEDDVAKKDALKEMFRDTAASIDMVKGSFDAVVGGLTDMGLAGDEATQQLLGDISNLMGAASQLATGIASMNPVSIIQGGIGVITSIFNVFNNDKRHERKIRELQEEVDGLSRAYDRLGRAIDNTYDAGVYRKMDAQAENLRQQQQLILQQMNEEDAKKRTDDDKMQEYRDKYEELGNQAEDLKKKQVEMLAGTDIQSAIDEFADALTEAYAQGEDGAKALGETTRKVLANAVKEALKKQLLGKALEDAVNQLGKDMEDGILSDSEKRRFEDSANSAGRRFTEAMRAYDDLFKETGNDTKDGVSGQLKDAMTEGTASQLVGLWNSTSIDMRELKQISLSNGETVSSILTDVSEIMRQNILIEQNTRRGADNTDGLIGELQSGFNALDRRLGEIERNTKVSKSRG